MIILSTYLVNGFLTEVQPAGDTNKRWSTISMSEDGSIIITGVRNGRLYISANTGKTWSEAQPAGNFNRDWLDSKISEDGNIIITLSSEGIYRSTNKGLNWEEILTSYDVDWTSVSMSSNGSVILVSYTDDLETYFLLSINSGSSWSSVTPKIGSFGTPVDKITSGMSKDGNIMVVAETGGRVYMSTNKGSTWSEIQPAGDADYSWRTVFLSENGSNIIIGSAESSHGRLYFSDDTGSTWSETQPVGNSNRFWLKTLISNNGNNLMVFASADGAFYSNNKGVDWETITIPGWGDIFAASMTNDASIYIVGRDYGRLYLYNDKILEIYEGNYYNNYFKGEISLRGRFFSFNNATCQYSLNNGTNWLSATTDDEYCYADNINPTNNIQLRFRARSNNEGEWTTSEMMEFLYDATSPASLEFNPTTRDWNNTNINIFLSASDTGSGINESSYMYCSTTSASCTPNIGGKNILLENNGEYTICFSVYDNLENGASTCSGINVYKIDKTLPVSTGNIISGEHIVGGASDGVYYTDIEYNVTATDTYSDVENIYYCIDSSNTCNPTNIYISTLTIDTDGNHYIRYKSIDNAGNEEDTKSSGLIKRNSSKINTPKIYIGNVYNNLYYNGVIGLRSEYIMFPTIECQYSINNGGNWNTANTNTTHCYINNINPTTNINVIFRGRINSSSSWIESDMKNYIYETNVPINLEFTPISRDWANTSIEIEFSAEDIGSGINESSYEYCINKYGSSCTPYASAPTKTITIADSGLWTVCFSVANNIGVREQTCSSQGVYKIDKEAPTTTGEVTTGNFIIGGENDGVYYNDIIYTLSPEDVHESQELSGVQSTLYCVDNINTCEPVNIYSTPIIINTNGNHYVRYKSTDNVGNEQTTQSSGLLEIDDTINIYFRIRLKDSINNNQINNFCVNITNNGAFLDNFCTTNGNVTTNFIYNNAIEYDLSFYNINNGYFDFTQNDVNIGQDYEGYIIKNIYENEGALLKNYITNNIIDNYTLTFSDFNNELKSANYIISNINYFDIEQNNYIFKNYTIPNKPTNHIEPKWEFISSSRDGKYLIIGDRAETYLNMMGPTEGRLHISTNYGITWTETRPAGNINYRWSSASISEEGDTIIAVSLGGPEHSGFNGRIWLNKNGNWENIPSSTLGLGTLNDLWQTTSISSDGNTILIGRIDEIQGKGDLYISTNRGTTWSNIKPVDRPFYTSDMSYDGNIIVVGTGGYSNGRLYKTENLGNSWSEIRPAGNVDKLWITVSLNKNGNTILAGAKNDRLYLSQDKGETWTEMQILGDTNQKWISTSINDEGDILYAAIENGGLYKSTNSGENWTQLNISGHVETDWRIQTEGSGNILHTGIGGNGDLFINGFTNEIEHQMIQSYLNITLQEAITQTPITEFTFYVNGTPYTNNDLPLILNSNIYNITIHKDENYLNTTKIINLPEKTIYELDAEIYDAEIQFYAYDIYNNEIPTFTIEINNEIRDNSEKWGLLHDTYEVEFNTENWYTKKENITLNQFDSITHNFTGLYQTIIRFKAKDINKQELESFLYKWGQEPNNFYDETQYQTGTNTYTSVKTWEFEDPIAFTEITNEIRSTHSTYTGFARYKIHYTDNTTEYTEEQSQYGNTYQAKTYQNPETEKYVERIELELKQSTSHSTRYAQAQKHNITQWFYSEGTTSQPHNIVFGDYNFSFYKKDLLPQTKQVNINTHGEKDIIFDNIGITTTLNLIDEKTLQPFDMTPLEEMKLLIYCQNPDRTEEHEILVNQYEINITCLYEKIKFQLDYGDGLSYYRNIISPEGNTNNQTIYLIDADNTFFLYSSFGIDDLLGKYINPSIWIKKQIEDKTVTIQSDFTDIENKVGLYLIRESEYIIELHSNNQPVKLIGRYTADQPAAKTINMYDVSLAIDEPQGYYQNVLPIARQINDSGIKSIQFSYQDPENKTTELTFKLYANNMEDEPIYTSQTYTSITHLQAIVAIPEQYENTTIISEILTVYEGEEKSVTRYHNENYKVKLGILEHINQQFLNWFLLIILSIIAIYSNVKTPGMGLAITLIALAFVLFGWIQISLGLLVVAILISLVEFMAKQR